MFIKQILMVFSLWLLSATAALAQFDQSHGQWNALLKKHVGRAAYPYANVRFSSFSFGTGLSHVDFTCKSGALKLDTITYSATVSDSLAVQTVSGKISQLRPDWVDRRTDPRGWCSVPSHPAVPSEGHPTPGILENGCPE